MDDPLVGLAFWQSETRRQDPAARIRKEASTVGQGRGSSSGEDSNRTKRERAARKEKRQNSEEASSSRKRVSLLGGLKRGSKGSCAGGGGGGGDGLSDNCFPCLPGIDVEREKAQCEMSESSSDRASPSHSHSWEEVEDEAGEVEDQKTGRLTPESAATPSNETDLNLLNSPVPQPQNFWLMRLFQSKLFDMSIAIGYLFNSKEADVQAYLGNKLFVSSHRALPVHCAVVNGASHLLPP